MARQSSAPSNPTFFSGRLRHRVMIRYKAEVQNQETGEVTWTWVNLTPRKLAAEISPVSAREFIASAAIQNEITVKVVMRWRSDVTPKMQVVHTVRGVDQYYNIEGVLADPKSGTEWMTLPCSTPDGEEL